MTAEQLNAERMIAALVAEEEREGGSPDEAALVCADAIQEAGDDARAELMRVQVELGKWQTEADNCPTGRASKDGHEIRDLCDRRRALESRQATLLTAHEPRWRNAGVCPECEGRCEWNSNDPYNNVEECQHCLGTGDAAGLTQIRVYHNGDGDTEEVWNNKITWRRGLPYAVHAENIIEVTYRWVKPTFSDPNASTYTAHPWAVAVTKHFPTVRAFAVDFYKPYQNGYGFAWFHPDRYRADHGVPITANVPPFLFEMLERGLRFGRHPDGRYRVDGRFVAHPTKEGAIDWLARTVMQFVKENQ